MPHKPIINPERTASHHLRVESRRSGRREGLRHRGQDRAGRLSVGAEFLYQGLAFSQAGLRPQFYEKSSPRRSRDQTYRRERPSLHHPRHANRLPATNPTWPSASAITCRSRKSQRDKCAFQETNPNRGRTCSRLQFRGCSVRSYARFPYPARAHPSNRIGPNELECR